MGAAGWHICFDVLDHLLSGTPIDRIVGGEAMKFGWQRLNASTQGSSAWSPRVGRPTPRSVEAWEEEPHGIDPAEAGPRRHQDHPQSQDHRLLDRHRALLPADELLGLRATAPAAGGGGVHPPRLPRLLPGGALVGQAPRRGADACAGAGAAQGVGLRRLRHQPRRNVPSQTFGKAGCATYPPFDADLEFAVVMHSTLFQSSLLSPHAGCHHLSELLSNQKRLPLAEVSGYAERS